MASTVAAQAGRAATDQVKQQVCAQVQNIQLSAQNKQVLAALLPVAKTAGLPSQMLTPLSQIVQSGDQAPAQAVATLRQACASATTSPTPSP